MRTEPMDCTGWSSNTGSKVVPPSSDFHTPPLAAPTQIVSLPSGISTASSDAMRPLMAAEPMLRTPRPEIVAASKEAGGASAANTAAQARSAAVAGM